MLSCSFVIYDGICAYRASQAQRGSSIAYESDSAKRLSDYAALQPFEGNGASSVADENFQPNMSCEDEPLDAALNMVFDSKKLIDCIRHV